MSANRPDSTNEFHSIGPVYTLPTMGVRAVISANSSQVQPGGSAVVTVTIRNTGAVVDHFHVDVLGDATQWATVTPATLPLFPDAQGLVTIDFRPPRSSAVRAGSVPFGVRVASEVNAGDATVEEGTLEVGVFTGLKAEMVPEISRARRVGRHQIACDNLGNTPLTLGFRGTDPENTLRFDFRPRNPVGQPGTATIVRLGVRHAIEFSWAVRVPTGSNSSCSRERGSPSTSTDPSCRCRWCPRRWWVLSGSSQPRA